LALSLFAVRETGRVALVKDQTQRTFESDLWLRVCVVHIRLRAVWWYRAVASSLTAHYFTSPLGIVAPNAKDMRDSVGEDKLKATGTRL